MPDQPHFNPPADKPAPVVAPVAPATPGAVAAPAAPVGTPPAPSAPPQERHTRRQEEDEEDDAPTRPAVGTVVAYRLRPYGEWLTATVIDNINGAAIEEPYEEGQVHLAVKVDRKRHSAASTTAYRLNVSPGTEQGQYALKRPAGAARDFAASEAAERMREEVRRELTRSNKKPQT